MSAEKVTFDPIKARDRIKEIDRATVDNAKERKQLIEQLKSEGFMLTDNKDYLIRSAPPPPPRPPDFY